MEPFEIGELFALADLDLKRVPKSREEMLHMTSFDFEPMRGTRPAWRTKALDTRSGWRIASARADSTSVGTITAVAEVAGALVWREAVEQFPNALPQAFHGALPGGT